MARALLRHGVTSFLPTHRACQPPSCRPSPTASTPGCRRRLPTGPSPWGSTSRVRSSRPLAGAPTTRACLGVSGSWPAQALAPWTPGAYHRLPANRRVSIVASVSVGGPSPADGPRSGKRPYDPRRLRTPGIRPVRQAHCVALHAGGIRVEPGWVVGVLLAAALLSTRIVAGSTGGSAAPTVPSIETNLARFYAAASSLPIVSADPAGESSGDASGGVTHSASPAVAAATPRPKATPRPRAAPRPKATPRPTAAPRPKATPRPTAAPVKKPAAQAAAAPTPRPAPTPKPTPAIVYQY